MASGTVAYTDTRGNKDYLGTIASQIGRRLKQASNMAADERAFAAQKAKEQDTTLEAQGMGGRGYFFKRALGSRFGGDKIARTRGRLGASGPGTDPTKNYKQRFRGGFDYDFTKEITSSAIVPISSALGSGLRGVESGLDGVSRALTTMGSGMSDLARGQNDLAKATYFNGMILRVMVTEIQRQQARLSAQREERSIEGGRPALPGGSGGGGGRRMINITPGAGGGKGTDFGDIARGAGQFLTNKSAYKTGGSLYKGGSGAYKSLRSGTNVVKNIPSAVDVATTTVRNIEKVKTPIQVASDAKKLVAGGAAFMGEADKAPKIANTVSKFLGAGSRIKKKMGPGAAGLGEIVEATVTNLDPKDVKALKATRAALAPGVGLASLGDEGLGMITNSPDVLKALDKADDVSDGAATAKTIAAAADAGASKAGLLSFLRGRKPKGLVRGSAFTRMLIRNPAGKAFLKKLPLIGAVAGGIFAIQRLLEGDFLGAGLELGSGLLGATGLAPASLALDGLLLARDFGAVPFAKGGLLTGRRPVNALMGEAGPEIVTPLNDETFIKFGEGILDAQKRNKSQFISLHQLPVKKALDDTVAKKSWWDGIKAFFGGGSGGSDTPPSSSSNDSGRAWWDPLGVFTGKNDGAKAQTPLLTPPPPITTGVTGSTAERNLAAFLSTLEASGDQNSMDALQVMLNRTALSKSGKAYTWAGNSLFEQITAEEQFSPYSAAIFGTSADPNAAAKYGNILSGSPAERRRKLLEIASGPDALNNLQTLFKGGDAASASRILADLQSDGALAKESRRYIQGRTSFRGYRSGSGDLNRGKGGNFFFNNQGTTGMIDRISPLPFTSLGTSELQSQQLNQSSAENLRSAFNMPTIINNYNTTTVASGDSGGESSGAAFTSLGLDAFTLPFSLASKA